MPVNMVTISLLPRYDWKAVQEYYDAGHSQRECRDKFGFVPGAWTKAARRGDITTRPEDDPDVDRRFKHDWSQIRAYYDLGHSLYACIAEFGFSKAAWSKAVRRGEIKPRPLRHPLAALLKSGSRSSIKRRLLNEGILKPECSRCGISKWREKRLSVQIDHINGVNNDYRLENLRMLCPNCHSLTETYGSRNRKR